MGILGPQEMLLLLQQYTLLILEQWAVVKARKIEQLAIIMVPEDLRVLIAEVL